MKIRNIINSIGKDTIMREKQSPNFINKFGMPLIRKRATYLINSEKVIHQPTIYTKKGYELHPIILPRLAKK